MGRKGDRTKRRDRFNTEIACNPVFSHSSFSFIVPVSWVRAMARAHSQLLLWHTQLVTSELKTFFFFSFICNQFLWTHFFSLLLSVFFFFSFVSCCCCMESISASGQYRARNTAYFVLNPLHCFCVHFYCVIRTRVGVASNRFSRFSQPDDKRCNVMRYKTQEACNMQKS